MAKKLVLVLFFLLVPSCAWAETYDVWIPDVEDSPADVVIFEEYDEAGEITTGSFVYPDWFFPQPLASYNEYDNSGLLATQYLDFGKGLLQYVKPTDDYVLARVGQYQYIFATGDFSSGFSGSAGVYSLFVGNNNYSYTYTYDTSFRLNTRGYLCYSNLQPYPSLTGSDFSYGIMGLLLASIAGLFICWLASLAFLSFKGGGSVW